MIIPDRFERLVEQRLKCLQRPGPLDGDHRGAFGTIAKRPRGVATMTLQLLDDFTPIRRVADHQKRKRLPVNQDIVDHSTPVVGHQAILDLVVGQPGDLVGRHPLQPFEDARAVERQSAHMADVE